MYFDDIDVFGTRCCSYIPPPFKAISSSQHCLNVSDWPGDVRNCWPQEVPQETSGYMAGLLYFNKGIIIVIMNGVFHIESIRLLVFMDIPSWKPTVRCVKSTILVRSCPAGKLLPWVLHIMSCKRLPQGKVGRLNHSCHHSPKCWSILR